MHYTEQNPLCIYSIKNNNIFFVLALVHLAVTNKPHSRTNQAVLEEMEAKPEDWLF